MVVFNISEPLFVGGIQRRTADVGNFQIGMSVSISRSESQKAGYSSGYNIPYHGYGGYAGPYVAGLRGLGMGYGFNMAPPPEEDKLTAMIEVMNYPGKKCLYNYKI